MVMPEFEEVMEAFPDLTGREMEVFLVVGQGLTNEEIGRHFFISRLTVRAHMKHIHDKLQIIGRGCLAVAASRILTAYWED